MMIQIQKPSSTLQIKITIDNGDYSGGCCHL